MEFRHRFSWIDVVIFSGLPCAAVTTSILLDTPYLVSILLFYGAPGIYVTFRFGQSWQALKGLLFAIIVSTPFAIVVDYIGTISGLWYVPQTLFKERFFGVIPFEDVLWMLSASYTVVVMYEILFDTGKHELIDRRIRYFVFFAFLVLSVFFLALATGNHALLKWDSRYAYLLLGATFFLIPALLFMWHFPKFLRRSAFLVGYFLYLTVTFEITATLLGQWVFMGRYLISPLIIFANDPIPYEELFFVGVVGPLAVVALYEFFDDDLR
jgi:lycopene cyclase domain-containing protein